MPAVWWCVYFIYSHSHKALSKTFCFAILSIRPFEDRACGQYLLFPLFFFMYFCLLLKPFYFSWSRNLNHHRKRKSARGHVFRWLSDWMNNFFPQEMSVLVQTALSERFSLSMSPFPWKRQDTYIFFFFFWKLASQSLPSVSTCRGTEFYHPLPDVHVYLSSALGWFAVDGFTWLQKQVLDAAVFSF